MHATGCGVESAEFVVSLCIFIVVSLSWKDGELAHGQQLFSLLGVQGCEQDLHLSVWRSRTGKGWNREKMLLGSGWTCHK